MSDIEEDPADQELDALYRRESSRDVSRPSDAVRRTVLRHAADLAAMSARSGHHADRSARQAIVHRGWRRPAAYGGLAAAALAGLLIGPLLMPPAPSTSLSPTPSNSPSPPSSRSASPSASPAPAPAPAPRPQELARQASEQVRAYGRQITPSTAPAAPAATETAKATAAPGATTAAAGATTAAAAPGAMADAAHLQSLLGATIDVDARDSNGRTALMRAVQNGRIGAVESLLARGADANAADADGKTPLQVALSRGDQAIAAVLRRAGAR